MGTRKERNEGNKRGRKINLTANEIQQTEEEQSHTELVEQDSTKNGGKIK